MICNDSHSHHIRNTSVNVFWKLKRVDVWVWSDLLDDDQTTSPESPRWFLSGMVSPRWFSPFFGGCGVSITTVFCYKYGAAAIYTSTIYIYNYMYGYNVFHRPHPVFSSILYVHVSEMLCTCQRCCARFPAVVHVSQKLRTFQKPPNNVRVQLHTH